MKSTYITEQQPEWSGSDGIRYSIVLVWKEWFINIWMQVTAFYVTIFQSFKVKLSNDNSITST